MGKKSNRKVNQKMKKKKKKLLDVVNFDKIFRVGICFLKETEIEKENRL